MMRGRAFVERPADFLFALVALSTLILVFLIPPFQAPDEQQHFYRSYGVASGHPIAERRGPAVGSELPASYVGTVQSFLGTRALHAERPIFKQKRAHLVAELDRPFAPDVHQFEGYPDTAMTGTPAFLPQAAGMRIGILLGASPLEQLYCARLANAILALFLSWCALRLMGGDLTFAHGVLALPMAQAQFASASADASIIAMALVIACCLASAIGTAAGERRRWLAVGLATVWLVSAKTAYVGVPVLAAVCIAYRGHKAGNGRQGLVAAAVLILLTIAVAALWTIIGSHLSVASNPFATVDEAGQVRFVLGHPVRFLEVLAATFRHQGLFYLRGAIGIFGWLTVSLPWAACLTAAVGLALILISPRASTLDVPAWLKALAFGAVAGSVVLIELALYIRWNGVNAPRIDGVQGRYFLPILFLGVLIQPLWPGGRLRRVTVGWAAAILLAVTIGWAHQTILSAYY